MHGSGSGGGVYGYSWDANNDFISIAYNEEPNTGEIRYLGIMIKTLSAVLKKENVLLLHHLSL